MRLAHLAAPACFVSLAALSLPACNDTPPPAAKGAWDVEFDQLDPSKCSIGPHEGKVGDVTTTATNVLEVNGTDGSTVTCSVVGTDTFTIDASASNGSDTLHIAIASISSKNTMSNPAKGIASYISFQTMLNFSSPAATPCDFYFITPQEQIGSGKIWVSFDCSAIDNGTQVCGLSDGVAAFEDCIAM